MGAETYAERRRLEAERRLDQERAYEEQRGRRAEQEARDKRTARIADRLLDALEAILDGKAALVISPGNSEGFHLVSLELPAPASGEKLESEG